MSHFGRMTFRNTRCAFSTVNVCHVGRNVYAARPERYHTPTTADSSLASNGRTSLAESLIPVRLTCISPNWVIQQPCSVYRGRSLFKLLAIAEFPRACRTGPGPVAVLSSEARQDNTGAAPPW